MSLMNELRIDDYKPDPVPKDTAELLASFDKHAAELRAALEKATPEALATEWACYWQGQEIMRMPRTAVLRNAVMNHLIHHRDDIHPGSSLPRARPVCPCAAPS